MALKTMVDVARAVDESPLGGFQKFIICTCFILSMIEGFDTQAIAFAAPTIAAQWKLPAASFGPIFSAGLLGSVIGTMGMGWVQDRLGRRMALLISVFAFGTLTILTTFAGSFQSLLALRFLAGIGLGGAVPNLFAYVSEFAPARLRATAVALTVAGFPFGAVVGGLIATPYIQEHGWKPIFWFGGGAPLLLIPVIWFGFPETIRFLVLQARSAVKVAALLRRINPSLIYDAEVTSFTLGEPSVKDASFKSLFKGALLPRSILLPLALFGSLLLAYCLLNWIPILLRQSGFGPETAIYATIVFSFAGIVGTLVLTSLIDRGGRPLLIMSNAYLVGCVSVASIGLAGDSQWSIMLAIFLAGFFVTGPQLSLTAYIANFYPTALRGTGIGWAHGVGRTGSLLGPLIGGLLLSFDIGPSLLFQLVSVSALVSAGALMALNLGYRDIAESGSRAVASDTLKSERT